MLGKDDFVLRDEGQPQRLAYFGRESEPLTLILLLDVSGSMRPQLDQVANTARESLKSLMPGDHVAIMGFARRSAVQLEFNDNHAEVARQLRSAVNGADLGSGTLINAAVVDAAAYMAKSAPATGRRAILVITDNLSINYKVDDEAVIRALDASDTVLNSIVFGRGIRPAPAASGRYRNPDLTPADVFHLAEATGGNAVKSDNAELSFREMIEKIRTRYTLAYHAPVASSGSFRKIEVALAPVAQRLYPNAEVHARNGYLVK